MNHKLHWSSFSIRIPYDEFLRVYDGSAKYVVTRCHDGRRIRFPANILRPFLTHSGIQGEFVIVYDENNKFQRIEKVS
ncbi:MAG: DUF2835 domain-containing protein [Gammaproteobacteria bacterium]|nr:DUF2835 domain-containing protein [Gammaproteobacteria bacterium]